MNIQNLRTHRIKRHLFYWHKFLNVNILNRCLEVPCPVKEMNSAVPLMGFVTTPMRPFPMPLTTLVAFPATDGFSAHSSCRGWSAKPATAPKLNNNSQSNGYSHCNVPVPGALQYQTLISIFVHVSIQPVSKQGSSTLNIKHSTLTCSIIWLQKYSLH